MKVLSFDFFARFGNFKKFNSSSSALTFSSIPKTAVQGIVGAIIGNFDGDDGRDAYLSHFNPQNFKCAIEVLHDNNKQTYTLNYRKISSLTNIDPISDYPFLREDLFTYGKTKKDRDKVELTPTPMQVLVNPRFRIHIYIEEEKWFNLLKERLFSQSSYYPLVMGCSNFPAGFENVAENEVEEIQLPSEEEILLHSVAPLQQATEVNLGFYWNRKDRELIRSYDIQHEIQPLQLKLTKKGRVADLFHEVMFNFNDVLPVQTNHYYQVEGKNVLFF